MYKQKTVGRGDGIGTFNMIKNKFARNMCYILKNSFPLLVVHIVLGAESVLWIIQIPQQVLGRNFTFNSKLNEMRVEFLAQGNNGSLWWNPQLTNQESDMLSTAPDCPCYNVCYNFRKQVGRVHCENKMVNITWIQVTGYWLVAEKWVFSNSII